MAEFVSSNASVVRSIRQRVLLNAWLRALRQPRPLPAIGDFQPDGLGDELPDMMAFNVEGEGEAARFFITQEGSRLTTTYGSEHIAPEKRINRYLDDAIGPDRYQRALPCYRQCLTRGRPTYSISRVEDPDGKEVTYERLLLPFGDGDSVRQIVGSYKAISIEGGFRVNNLMGVSSKTVPTRLVNAVIDLELGRRPVGVRLADDIIIAESD
jgi:hypothetical protein